MQCRVLPDHQQLLSRHHQCILALLAIRQGVWKELDAEKNLIALLYYRRQLKGEDMKYGMLLGVDAVLFYQLKAEANGIVWKRTK